MKKVFLVTSFSHVVDAQGTVLPDFRANIEHILQTLRAEGDLDVFCAMEYEDWHLSSQPAEVSVRKDLAEIDFSDTIIVLLHDNPSAGSQFELGYSVAKGKHVILAIEEGAQLPYFNQGAVSAGSLTLITYNDVTELAKQLTIAAHTPETVTG